jgi:hypothetical protein
LFNQNLVWSHQLEIAMTHLYPTYMKPAVKHSPGYWQTAGLTALCLGVLLFSGLSHGRSNECPTYPVGTVEADEDVNCTAIITSNGYTITNDAAVLFRYTDRVELNGVLDVDAGVSLEIEAVPNYTYFTCATGCHYNGL